MLSRPWRSIAVIEDMLDWLVSKKERMMQNIDNSDHVRSMFDDAVTQMASTIAGQATLVTYQEFVCKQNQV